jgi:hypothetical protein
VKDMHARLTRKGSRVDLVDPSNLKAQRLKLYETEPTDFWVFTH